ncbi:MAG: hypothetical protein ACRBB3_01925 [Alphaproteobacteria bacterium]
MSVNYKTAKHICNVIRRQVQSSYPDLYINFIVHTEGGRPKAFSEELDKIREHPAGDFAIDHVKDPQFSDILRNSRSCFSLISYDKQPGFLGFFQSNSYLSICFINYERFKNEDNIRNHAFHLAWHAISLYNDYINSQKNDNNDQVYSYKNENNILLPTITQTEWKHRNLQADIFSSSIQTLLGRENSLNILSKQRIYDTLNATPGFIAENFPFPVCLDTLDFVFQNKIDACKKRKKTALAAAEIAEEMGKAYDESSIAQWKLFSTPTQEMAWLGHDPKSILGAAIYTSENTYAQSIADMISEKMDLKPKIIPTSQDYNPFTTKEANERNHKKQCLRLLDNVINQIDKDNNQDIIKEIVKKQSASLEKESMMGWCSSALIQTQDYIEQHKSQDDMDDLYKNAKNIFIKEVDAISWETLASFSIALLEYRRNHTNKGIKEIIKIAERNDEFSSIYHALSAIEKYKQKVSEEEKKQIEEQEKLPSNITDFISPNAIKK